MGDVLLWLAASGSTLAAFGLGLTRGRSQRTPAQPRPVELLCGCSHEMAYHDPATGKCHEDSDEYIFDPRIKRSVAKPCPCRQYTGPKPIDTVFQPRLVLPPSSEEA